MKIERMIEIDASDIRIGDRIHLDDYTATCQEITTFGALFLFDQYIYIFGHGCKDGSQKMLQSEKVLKIFEDIRDRMVPFITGDLLKASTDYCYEYEDKILVRPVFQISMRKDK